MPTMSAVSDTPASGSPSGAAPEGDRQNSALTRRRILFSGTAVVGLGLAAACGSSGGDAGAPAARPLDKNQKDDLVWLVWSSDSGARKAAYDLMVKRFNAQFPNVTVTRLVGSGGGLQITLLKLTAMLAAGERVDVVGTREDFLPTYVERMNPLRDLRPFMAVDRTVVKESDHPEGIIAGLTWKGTLYGLPVGVYTNNAILNLDLLRQNGIPRPAPNWTIDQALEIARKTTVRRTGDDDSTWGFFHQWEATLPFTYTWIKGNGGDPLVPGEGPNKAQFSTDQETLNTYQWLVDLAQRVGVMPGKTIGAATGYFAKGQVAINVASTNNLWGIFPEGGQGAAQFAWDVHPLPMMKRGRYQPIRSFSYGISRNSQNPDLAWALLKDMVGPEGQKDWYANARFAPSIKSLLTGAFVQDTSTPANKKAIADSILDGKALPKSPAWVEIDDVAIKIMTQIRAGEVSVRDGLGELDRQAQQLLRQ
jgi:multiple sugar transport system substrate-binding protein